MKRQQQIFNGCLVALACSGFTLCGCLSLCAALQCAPPLPRPASPPSAALFPSSGMVSEENSERVALLGPIETPVDGNLTTSQRLGRAIRNHNKK